MLVNVIVDSFFNEICKIDKHSEKVLPIIKSNRGSVYGGLFEILLLSYGGLVVPEYLIFIL